MRHLARDEPTAHPEPAPRGSRMAPWTAAAIAVLLASAGILARSILVRPMGDVARYLEIARAFAAGGTPYRDFACEYPPYALLLFLVPGSSAPETYAIVFSSLVVAAHLATGAILLGLGLQSARGWRGALPAIAFSAISAAQNAWFVRRFDLFAALCVLLALWATARRRHGLCGAALAIGALLKLFPLALAPMLLALAWRDGRARRFAAGVALGAAPAALLAASWPWWHFADLHAGRGLEVESLSASLAWLGHHLFGWTATWVPAPASYEVQGPWAGSAVGATRIGWALASLATAAVAARMAWREGDRAPARLAALSLLPLLGFAAFGPVLSPQYAIWLEVPAALALASPRPRPALVVLLACAATPLIYPSASFRTGLDLPTTLLLFVRNAAWVGAAAWLFAAHLPRRRSVAAARSSPSSGSG